MPYMPQKRTGNHYSLKACDTDILVIAISTFEVLSEAGIQDIWLEFGRGQSIRWLPIHDLALELGREKCKGLSFFHAFTVSDDVSAFRGRGKKSAWQTWENFPGINSVFKHLSSYPPVISQR